MSIFEPYHSHDVGTGGDMRYRNMAYGERVVDALGRMTAQGAVVTDAVMVSVEGTPAHGEWVLEAPLGSPAQPTAARRADRGC
ncbi:MAG: hypothetical protein ACXWBN_02615 [Acidimicrobiales bacterium]